MILIGAHLFKGVENDDITKLFVSTRILLISELAILVMMMSISSYGFWILSTSLTEKVISWLLSHFRV